MKAFRYIAKTGTGDQVEGLMDGESSSGVSRALLAKGIFPVEVSEVFSQGRFLGRVGLLHSVWQRIERRRLGSQSLALFTRRLGDLLDAGLPMQKAIFQLHQQTGDKALKSVLRSVAFRVKGGESLSQALTGYGSMFPRSLIGAVEAGETGGGLIPILHGLADLYEKDDDMERTVRAALLYPTLVVLVSLATLTVMFLYLLPRLSVLYADLGQDLPGPTQFLIDSSAFFQAKGWLVFGALMILILGFSVLKTTSPGFRKILALMALKMPFIGRIILNREIVRFAHTLASLVGGGVPLMRSLWFAAKSSGNDVIIHELEGFGQQVAEGASLSQVIDQSRIGDNILVMMIQVGEEMGELSDSLQKACRVYERELREKMKIISTVLEPMMIVTLGLIVGFIVFSMLLPIMEINLV